jgi:hypothetical protein
MQGELGWGIEEKQPTPTASLCGSTNQGARSKLRDVYHEVLCTVTTACHDYRKMTGQIGQSKGEEKANPRITAVFEEKRSVLLLSVPSWRASYGLSNDCLRITDKAPGAR